MPLPVHNARPNWSSGPPASACDVKGPSGQVWHLCLHTVPVFLHIFQNKWQERKVRRFSRAPPTKTCWRLHSFPRHHISHLATWWLKPKSTYRFLTSLLRLWANVRIRWRIMWLGSMIHQASFMFLQQHGQNEARTNHPHIHPHFGLCEESRMCISPWGNNVKRKEFSSFNRFPLFRICFLIFCLSLGLS